MTSKLHLKLAIGILLIFGLLILGYVLYEPVWYRIQASRLCSNDEATRDAAAMAVVARGESAIPYIREWLKSGNEKLKYNTCLLIAKFGEQGLRSDIQDFIDITNRLYEIAVRWELKGYTGADNRMTYIALEGDVDPDDDFLRRLADLKLKLGKRSECEFDGGCVKDGRILRIYGLRWNSNSEVEITVGVYYAPLAGSGGTIRIKRVGDIWKFESVLSVFVS